MVFFWPHTHSNIFLEPFKLVLESFSFGFGHPFMLFDGEIYRTLELPKKYILVNLLYKMPEYIVISFVIFFLFYIKLKKNYEVEFKNFNFRILLIFAIILFPNLLNIVNPYGIYDGLRLFLFIIPYISIIPAILIFFLYKNIKNNLYKFTFVLIILLKVFFLFNFFTLTPYHYVYLNIFAGKYSENWKKFENDYWGVSTKKLISSIKNHKDFFEDKSIKIAVCGLPARAQEIYLRKIKNLKFKMVSKDEKFDYMIMNNRVFLDKENKSFDPKMARSCFQKFSGEDLIKIERRGLVIAKITKI